MQCKAAFKMFKSVDSTVLFLQKSYLVQCDCDDINNHVDQQRWAV